MGISEGMTSTWDFCSNIFHAAERGDSLLDDWMRFFLNVLVNH